MFSVKDPVLFDLPFACRLKLSTSAGFNACYVGETSRHIMTYCIRAHLRRERTSHIFQHLQHYEECRSLCSIKVLLLNFRYGS